jgi:predicted nucleotidyltransferase
MNRSEILEVLDPHRDELRRQFGAQRLGLFGSAARDALRDDSDIDILVAFDGAATFDRYFDLKDRLETLLGRPVDLVTEAGFEPRARRHVERNLIPVAQLAALSR